MCMFPTCCASTNFQYVSCVICINTALCEQGERVLFHYNGHGVPRPTANGEVWVFNKSYTQYIPLSVFDLQVLPLPYPVTANALWMLRREPVPSVLAIDGQNAHLQA